MLELWIAHSFKSRELCPAFGTTCNCCGKQNHWSKVCKSQDPRQNKSQLTRGRGRQRGTNSGRSRSQYGSRSQQNTSRRDMHMLDDTAFPSGDTDNQFDQLTLDIVISDISPSSTDRDEAYTYVQLKQNTERCIINLRAKIDTGAQTNTIPIRMYRRMYPTTLDSNGFPRKGQLSPSSSILRAYNGTQIKQYGMLQLPCKYGKSEWHTALFHICETDGPAIIGLRTVLRLNIVALNCSVESDTSPVETQRCQPIASVQDLKSKYLEQFDAIGNFSGAYHIVLRDDVQHAYTLLVSAPFTSEMS